MATHKLSSFVPLNIFPKGVHHIGVYKKTGEKVGIVELGDLANKNTDEKLYSFGLLSDVHNQSNQAAESYADLKNAIKYFTDTEHVEFTCICGDLGQTYNLADSELEAYKNNIDSVEGHAPVYPTTGNHDCPYSGNTDIARFKSKTGITDLFTSEATYSYEITKTHGATIDHFLFLGLRRWETNFPTGYLDEDITWLGNKLKAYQNDRCFIITHLFFPDWAGNFGRYYPQGNWLGGNQLTNLKKLATDYPRAIWFSGHSHWKWYLQALESKANVYPYEPTRFMAQTVHVSSCAKPIDSDDMNPNASGDRDENIGNKESEGAVVDVYADRIEFRGFEFKRNGSDSYENKIVPIACYSIKTNPYDGYVIPEVPTQPEGGDGNSDGVAIKYMTASLAQEHTGKNHLYKVNSIADLDSVTTGAGVYVDETTHDLTVKLCAVKAGFFIADGGEYSAISATEGKMVGTDIAEGSAVTILHDGIEWISAEPTSAQKAKIGFYGGGYVIGQSSTTYTLDSGITVDTSKGCLQLQTSSSFSGALPAVFTIKNFRYSQEAEELPEPVDPSEPSDTNDGYHYLTQDMVFNNPRKTAGVSYTVNANHDLSVTFTANSQGVMINDGGTFEGNFLVGGYITTQKNASTPESLTDHVEVLFDGIDWSPSEPSSTAKTKIGIWRSATGYQTTSGMTVVATSYGAIEMNTSSSYSTNGGTYPVTMTLRNFRFKKV